MRTGAATESGCRLFPLAEKMKNGPPKREAVLMSLKKIGSGNDALLGFLVEEVNTVGVNRKRYDLADLGL